MLNLHGFYSGYEKVYTMKVHLDLVPIKIPVYVEDLTTTNNGNNTISNDISFSFPC